jgi:hypothetical protein
MSFPLMIQDLFKKLTSFLGNFNLLSCCQDATNLSKVTL